MKWILALFPRPVLIWVSIKIRPFLRWWYRGSEFYDPIDGRGYRKFLSYGYHTMRPNALSPGTLSLERHRLLWLYLERETSLLTQNLRVLHVAPEQAFYQRFKNFPIGTTPPQTCTRPWLKSKLIFVLFLLRTTAMTLFYVTTYWNILLTMASP